MAHRSLVVGCLALAGCWSGATTPPIATTSPPPAKKPAPRPEGIHFTLLRDGANCDGGNWVPGNQEYPEYLECTTDADCVKMLIPGCCAETYVAIRRNRACGSDHGSTCDMVCNPVHVEPPNAYVLHAACVARACALVR